jgi:hypothetical protein
MKKLCIALIVLGTSSVAMAAAPEPGGLPVLPEHPIWAGVMVYIVAGLFLAAATIGPLVAVLMPTAVEPESHDEHELDEHDNHGAQGHGAHGHGAHGH